MDKALDDNDEDQLACLKMCMDRMIPASYFEKDKAGGSKGVTIQIVGVGETKINETEDYIEGEVIEDGGQE
jgi:hypothetical protein